MAGKHKRPLTHDEWREVGILLKQADRLLFEVVKKVQVSVSTVRQDKIIKVTRRIDAIKSDLENEAARQHPEWGPPNYVFYGAIPLATELGIK